MNQPPMTIRIAIFFEELESQTQRSLSRLLLHKNDVIAVQTEAVQTEALFGSQLFSEVPITLKGILLFYSIK